MQSREFLCNYNLSVFGYSSIVASIRSFKISLRLIIRGKRSGSLLLERGGDGKERGSVVHDELVFILSSQEF